MQSMGSSLQVLKRISVVQSSNCLFSLDQAFQLTNVKFIDKYVKCSVDATKLIENFSNKFVHFDMTL